MAMTHEPQTHLPPAAAPLKTRFLADAAARRRDEALKLRLVEGELTTFLVPIHRLRTVPEYSPLND